MEINSSTTLNISEKVLYPSDKEPSYDFVVKLNGPNGSNLRNIAAYTKTNILILGKGSMEDRSKEEELSKRSDPEYQHLKEPLHVLVQADGSKYAAEFGVSTAVDAIKMHMFEYINTNSESLKSDNAPYLELQKPFDFENQPNEKISISEKVLLPVKKNSSYNIVAAILGPKGSNLKSITRSTKTRISILGEGSMRDRATEEEYIESGDPDYAHLNEPLHVLIETAGPRCIAQSRLDAAVTEIKTYVEEEEIIIENEFENTRYLSAQQPFDNDEFVNSSEKKQQLLVNDKFVNSSEKKPPPHVDINEKKVYYPSDKEPSSSFMTNLIGVRGSNLRRIAEHTKTKISIRGKGSTKDKYKEEELSKSSDPQHQHFNEPLHVVIQAWCQAGGKYEAESRLNDAVNEIKMQIDKDVKLVNSDSQNSSSLELQDPFGMSRNEKIFLSEKVLFPVKENSSYNIVARLLGPKGSNLRSIATCTKTRISILGKGSMRDRVKEDEFIKSGDPKYAHLNEPLHALIQTAGPRHVAQSRLDVALTEIKRYIHDEEGNERNVENEYGNTGYSPVQRPFDDEYASLREKVLIPVEKYPLCNFIGRLLGPKGSNLKSIGASTKARISILGKGSAKDTYKEKEFSDSSDPKYDHFKEPLHVLIQVTGPKNASRERLEAAVFEVNKCIDDEINRIPLSHSTNSSSQTRRPFDNEENVSLTEKVYFPVEKYPTYNFIGKLLGPKGSNLKSIAGLSKSSSTKTKISILGKGSGKDKQVPSKSTDVEHEHFKEPLHVLINVSGPKYAAQSRLSSVLDEIKKYTDPKNIELEMHNTALNKPITQENPFSSTERSSNIITSYYGEASNKNVSSGKCYYYMPGDKRPQTSYSLSQDEKKPRFY